ncbi:MAG: hypothetical protein RL757_2736 [Bacteroidota bacterium]|jgi:hypothetical protein
MRKSKCILVILLFATHVFAQQPTAQFKPFEKNDKRFMWVLEMVEVARLYEKQDSSIYKIDKYYEDCISRKKTDLSMCEKCAVKSLDTWNALADTLFRRLYERKRDTLQMEFKQAILKTHRQWLQLKTDMSAEREMLMSKVNLNSENYILLFFKEINMTRAYVLFLNNIRY